MNDTGESTAEINRRADELAWATVLPMLHSGAILRRVPKLRRSYVDGHGGLSDAFVRRLLKSNLLQEAGLDQYTVVKR